MLNPIYKREFLNPIIIDRPGAITVSYHYNNHSKQFTNIQLSIGDCSRTIHIEFELDESYLDIGNKKEGFENSKLKIDILKKHVDEIHAAIHATVLTDKPKY